MNENPVGFKWSKEDAEHNYELCRKRLTVPLPELNAELDKLLGSVIVVDDINNQKVSVLV